MFSYCFINVMEKIQSLESRTDQADWEGDVCCRPEARVCGSVNAYLQRSTSLEASECFRVRIWEDSGSRAAHGRPPPSSGQNPPVT